MQDTPCDGQYNQYQVDLCHLLGVTADEHCSVRDEVSEV